LTAFLTSPQEVPLSFQGTESFDGFVPLLAADLQSHNKSVIVVWSECNIQQSLVTCSAMAVGVHNCST